MTHASPLHVDEYEAPGTALVERALERLGSPQHRQFFYSRLENPKWVAPLAARGAFADIPASTVDETGGPQFEAWPQGEYLARMAGLVPNDVAAVLAHDQFKDTDNPIVQRAVVAAASGMPADQAQRLVNAICLYLSGTYRVYLDPEPLVAIIVLLAHAGQRKPAKKLAQAIYRPGGRDGIAEGAGLDPYRYAHTLPQVVSALKSDPKTLNMVAVWLDLWTESGVLVPSIRSMWRSAVEAGQPDAYDRMTYQVGHALVDAVRDLAHGNIDVGMPLTEILAVFEHGQDSIFERLALDALCHAAARELATVRDSSEPTIGGPAGTVELALEKLTDPDLLGGEFRPEYVRLARTVLSQLTEAQLELWEQLIAHPPHLTPERVARRLGASESEITAEQVATHIGRWERDLLAEIGRDALPQRLADRLDELTGSHGLPPEAAQASARDFPFVMDISPRSDAELAALSPEELVAFVSSWEPAPATSFSAPSTEGLTRAIGRVIAANPAPYAQQADVFASFGPGYVGAVMDGLREAIGQQRIFPWAQVLELIAACATRHDQQQDEDADETWRFTLQRAADLVRLGLNPQPGAIGPELFGTAWAALEPITKSPYPTCEEEQTYGPPSTDALTFSLNSTRPVALRAAIRLLLSIYEQHSEPDSTQQTVATAVLAALDEHAGPDKDESLAAAAVFGEGLGTLLIAASDWTHARLERLLGPADARSLTEAEQAWFETAWNVTLAGYRPSRGLFEPLEPWFMIHLTALADERSEAATAVFSMRSPKQTLADHVLVLSVTGQLVDGFSNRALSALFEFGDTALMRNALGHLGWQLRHSQGDVPDTVLARFRDLWNWRQQQVEAGAAERRELLDFYWWVTSGRFDAEWWLPRLLLVAQDPEFDTHQMLGESLAQAAPDYPAETLDVFVALHENGQTLASYDLLEHAPAILAPAMASSDAELSRRAAALADQMGREGFVDLMDRITALLGQVREGEQPT